MMARDLEGKKTTIVPKMPLNVAHAASVTYTRKLGCVRKEENCYLSIRPFLKKGGK